MIKEIVIYADAGGEIGMGHVVRMAHLAKLFGLQGHMVTIITDEEGEAYFHSVGIKAISMQSSWGPIIRAGEIVIVDHMLTGDSFLQLLRPHVKKLVVVVGAGHTITAATRWIADLVIYQCPSRENLYDIIPGEQIISGFNHLILNPRYAVPMNETDRGNDFVAYFGGGTKRAFAEKIVAGLRNKDFTVNWVGKTDEVWNPGLYEALSLATSFVGTMGMVTYEALATGTNPLVFSRSDDHLEIAKHLDNEGLVTSFGLLPERSMKVDKYVDRISKVHEIMIEQRKIANTDYSVVDGKGAFRVAREILND